MQRHFAVTSFFCAVADAYTPFTRYNRVKPVEQPAASCKQTFNQLFNRLRELVQRLYRANGVFYVRFLVSYSHSVYLFCQ